MEVTIGYRSSCLPKTHNRANLPLNSIVSQGVLYIADASGTVVDLFLLYSIYGSYCCILWILFHSDCCCCDDLQYYRSSTMMNLVCLLLLLLLLLFMIAIVIVIVVRVVTLIHGKVTRNDTRNVTG